MMSERFDWIPFYRELAQKLLAYEHRQPELVAMLDEIRQKGFPVVSVMDEDAQKQRFLLTEIDPFTFFGSFNRGLTEQNLKGILAILKEKFGIQSDVPRHFNGIPAMNKQKSWFIGYQHIRQPQDVQKLWTLFKTAMVEDPLNSPQFDQAFDSALLIKGARYNLTMGLFWIRPDTFVGMDGVNRAHLGVNSKPPSSQSYREFLKKAAATGLPFYELSHQAHQNRSKPPKIGNTNEPVVWVVGGAWDAEQADNFRENSLWRYDYDDQYNTDILQMKPGDRLIWKENNRQSTNLPFDNEGYQVTSMNIKAVGTITENPGDGHNIKVKWEEGFQPKTWYFYTSTKPVWRLSPDHDLTDNLLDFVFKNIPQDYDYFVERWRRGAWKEQSAELSPGELSLLEISEKLGVPVETIQSWLTQLKRKGQVIFQGPPGTGKTFVGQHLANLIVGESGLFEKVQFHPSYSYEDFIQGFRPTSVNGQLVFELKDGVFKQFCQKAQETDATCVFLIDEINRANLSKVFGELMYLLEYRSEAIQLQSGEPFSIPQNVLIIGTMNTADRSIALMDHALRRRFVFLDLLPNYDLLYEHLQDSELNIESLITTLQAINETIGDPHYWLGHSYFLSKPQQLAQHLQAIWEGEIYPYLSEYFFDQPDRIKPFAWERIQKSVYGLPETSDEMESLDEALV